MKKVYKYIQSLDKIKISSLVKTPFSHKKLGRATYFHIPIIKSNYAILGICHRLFFLHTYISLTYLLIHTTLLLHLLT
jgi:hypothetical protein